MKLHTTKSLIATAILGALFLYSSDTFAVQPKLKQSDRNVWIPWIPCSQNIGVRSQKLRGSHLRASVRDIGGNSKRVNG